MKSKTAKIAIIATGIVISIAIIAVLINYSRSETQLGSQYTYLEGTVTAYDETPSYVDGAIIFSIDNVPVDIGGGMRPSSVYGEVDESLKVGDRVEAKLIGSQGDETLTVYDCVECYVRRR